MQLGKGFEAIFPLTATQYIRTRHYSISSIHTVTYLNLLQYQLVQLYFFNKTALCNGASTFRCRAAPATAVGFGSDTTMYLQRPSHTPPIILTEMSSCMVRWVCLAFPRDARYALYLLQAWRCLFNNPAVSFLARAALVPVADHELYLR